MSFVLDASVTMAWCFADEVNAYTETVLERLQSSAVLVPAIWPLEVANVLLVSERRQRLTQAQTTRFVELLQALPITVDHGQKGLDLLLALGREHKLSAYDAAYLELAVRSGLALATQDARLSAAAKAIGVSLVE